MTVSTVSKLAEFAQLTVASYALFSQSSLNNLAQQKAALKDAANMTEEQASDFLDKYTLIHHTPNNETGFSATIFRDKSTGKIIFAARGTEIPSNVVPDLIVSDIFQIGPEGYAKSQAISMYRYWKQLTTIGGQPVNYSEAEMYKLYAISANGSGFDYTNFCLSLKEDKGIDAGQPAGSSLIATNTIIDVTGHSLGGHLAMLFSRFFPSNTAEVVTLNAPGFFIGSNILTQNGIAPFDNSKITRIEAEGDGISKLGASEFWPGTKVLIAQENKSGAIAAISSNHSSVNGCDSLALMSLFAKIDTRYSGDADGVSNLIRAASSVPDHSFEKTLDYIRKFITGASVILTPISSGANDVNREYLYKNINEITTSGFFKTLAGKLKIDVSPANLFDRARTDFSAFISLFTLSPISLTGVDAAGQSELITQLTSAWQTEFNQWQDDADKADSDRVFTDAYLQDRAAMLSWVVQGNLTDSSSTGNDMSITSIQAGTKAGLQFSDAASGEKISVTINSGLYQGQYDDSRTRELHSVSFGGSANDTLSGEHQYGGAGDDILQGSTAASYLEGGNGTDTYQLVSGGVSTVVDCDGKGIITVDGKEVKGTFSTALVPIEFSASSGLLYYSADKNYRLSKSANGVWLLAAKTATTGYSTVAQLSGWNSGDFGISLDNEVSMPRNTLDLSNTNLYLVIDASASKTDTIIKGGKNVDYIKGSGNKDFISTGEGNSFVMSWGGDDQILGGSGRDLIISGGNAYPSTISDNDIVKGGSGTDLISTGGGDDILWADTDNDSYLNETADSAKTGDWLSGSKGSDFLYGSSSQDVLFGGSEDDFIKGGAGNDLILGDASYLPYGNYASIVGPTVLSCVMNESQGWPEKTNDSYNPLMVVSGAAFAWTWSITADKNIAMTSQLTDFTSFLKSRVDVNAGDDILDGGKGNDWIAGQAGNDTLFGGDGDDILYGDDAQTLNWGVEGNDKIYTGAGIDYAYGGSGNDVINATDEDNEKDWLYGGAGDDILFGGTGKDQLQGDAGNDDLYAGTDGSTLLGGEGNDYLVGDIGNDDMQGGTGSDFYASSSGTDVWTDESGSDVYQLSSSDFTGATKTTIIDTDGLGVILIDGINLTGQEVKATSETTWSANSGLFNLTLSNSDLVVTFPKQAASGQAIIQGFVNTGSYLGIKLPEYTAPQPTNQAPTVATAIADQTGKENIAFSYVVPANTFADSDSGETLTFSATLADGSALPSWIKFDAATRTFTGTPLSGNSGLFNIQVTATDHAGASVNDTFSLKIVSETINGTAGADTLSGSATTDKIYGLAGNDTLTGNAGDDVLDGGDGADKLIGGVGNDTYYIDNSGDVVGENYNEGYDTINSSVSYNLAGIHAEKLVLTGSENINVTGNSLDNNLAGNSGANILSGGLGIDILFGNAGDDVLDGGSGADKLIGGAGNDTYYIDNAGDVVGENYNEGYDTINSSVSYNLAGIHAEKLVLTGTANINVTGNSLDNHLVGNSGANTLSGGIGNDVLDGGSGADKLIGGVGNDTYYIDNSGDVVGENYNEGYDTINSSVSYNLAGIHAEKLVLTGTANINVTGNSLDNILAGNSGANILSGGLGIDILFGNAGDDVLDGGDGADKLIGGIGNDTYYINNAGDVVGENYNEGYDTINCSVSYNLAGIHAEKLVLTGAANINVTGNSLDNHLAGNSGANTLSGGLGIDTLFGNAGDDVLDGGSGADILNGGTGNDTYILGRGYGSDSINEDDTTAANTDMVKFQSGIAANQLWFTQSGNNLDVSVIGTSDKMTVQNWYSGNAYHVEQFKTSDGKTLLDSQVANLVSAMASMTPPAAGQTMLPQNYQDQLAPVLAANWK